MRVFAFSVLLLLWVLVGPEILAQSEDGSADKGAETTNQPSTNQADGWHVFRGGAGSTGVARSELADELDVLWTFKVKNGAFEGTAAIAQEPGDEHPTVYLGDLDGLLLAFDLETGEKKWQYKTPLSFSASPAYQNGRIYIGDIDGIFYCIDRNGELVWKFEADSEISASANFYRGNVLFGSHDSRLYLLDAKSGDPLWKLETADQIQCSSTIVGDRAFVAGCDGFLHIVDLEKGKELSKVDISSPTRSTPATLGEKVFFGTEQAEFLAVDWKESQWEWSFEDDKGVAAVRGCAAVTEDHIVFGARNRRVYSLDPKTGDEQWSTRLKAKVDSSPVIVGNQVIVGSTDGRLYSLSLETGEKNWEKELKGGIISSPAIAFGKLVIATDRGVVYCLGSKSNK